MADVFHHLLSDIGVAIMSATLLGLARPLAAPADHPRLPGRRRAGRPAAGLRPGSSGREHRDHLRDRPHPAAVHHRTGDEPVGHAVRRAAVAGRGLRAVPAVRGRSGVGFFALLGYGLKRDARATASTSPLMCGAVEHRRSSSSSSTTRSSSTRCPAELTLGVLVIQDIYAIFVLAFQPNFANPSARARSLKALGRHGGAAGGRVPVQQVRPRAGLRVDRARRRRWWWPSSIGWCAAVAGTAAAMGLSQGDGRAGRGPVASPPSRTAST